MAKYQPIGLGQSILNKDTERERKREGRKESRDGSTYLPSNLCFKKSNSAFCIISVT
jgi:hypothetical protein